MTPEEQEEKAFRLRYYKAILQTGILPTSLGDVHLSSRERKWKERQVRRLESELGV
jgi:RNA:NAD 2'-phosphotransferase (TPT1/KptA family)